MHIHFFEIQNFRKLKACRVELTERETIFVGANNSGKTSAMDALIRFLSKNRHNDFVTTDFTLSNWTPINLIGEKWVDANNTKTQNLDVHEWLPWLPTLDVWLQVRNEDLHRVVHLLPALDWTPDQLLGVRFTLEPKKLVELYKNFRSTYLEAKEAKDGSRNPDSSHSLWPGSMKEFLDRGLKTLFTVRAYILDPSNLKAPENGIPQPQLLPSNSEAVEGFPFDGLVNIDVIHAQRGFSDSSSEAQSAVGFERLSAQLNRYFDNHLNPSDSPNSQDFDFLEVVEGAKSAFNEQLEESFKDAIAELEGLNYPGLSDPKITLTSNIDLRDGLSQDTAVQYEVSGSESVTLPEKHNGLGYQNLISMAFKLISFRDKWMRTGKAFKRASIDDAPYELLHLVLVEEPEAHLHVQIQQVFIRKAYEVLRNHSELKDSNNYKTQMIVSTHSSHIAHERDFSCLRYFRRETPGEKGENPTATVINLSETFGDQHETTRFVTRYIRTTHCDLFFADAVILVEGSSERMLIPHFIRQSYTHLNHNYISILEIGGAHAHRLKPMLNILRLLCLVITDLDSVEENCPAKTRPIIGRNYRTGNTTLKKWVPKKESLDDLLDLNEKEKQTKDGLVKVVYPCLISVDHQQNGLEEGAIPYTFEDALALANIPLFLELEQPMGLLKKLQDALKLPTLESATEAMFCSLGKGNKAEMALELLYRKDPEKIEPPHYIVEGLSWLEQKLKVKTDDIV